MKKSRTISLLAILILSLTFFLGVHQLSLRDDSPRFGSKTTDVEKLNEESISRTGKKSIRTNNRSSGITFEKLEQLGYEILSRERTETGAEGDVRVIMPSGTVITARKLRLSSTGDDFHLYGDVVQTSGSAPGPGEIGTTWKSGPRDEISIKWASSAEPKVFVYQNSPK